MTSLPLCAFTVSGLLVVSFSLGSILFFLLAQLKTILAVAAALLLAVGSVDVYNYGAGEAPAVDSVLALLNTNTHTHTHTRAHASLVFSLCAL